MTELKKLLTCVRLLAYALKYMVSDITLAVWHTVRCEALGREWSWAMYTTEIDGDEYEFAHCSCCGYERRIPAAYI